MELLGDLFEVGVKALLGWLLSLFWLSYYAVDDPSRPNGFVLFVVCTVAIWYARELIRRPRRSGGSKH